MKRKTGDCNCGIWVGVETCERRVSGLT